MAPKPNPLPTPLTAGALALVQVFDIVLHVATNQAEPLRIIANLAVLQWLAGAGLGRLRPNFHSTGVAAVVVYLVLNGAFLAQAGLTNPAQGGAPRVALFVLVALTLGLSGALLVRGPRAASDR